MEEKWFKVEECPEAYLQIKIYDSDIAELANIYVPEEHRRKGYGTKMIKEALAYLKERGYNRVTVYFFTNMAINMTFKIADKVGIQLLPRFWTERDFHYYPIRYRTKEEMKNLF